MSLEFFYSLLLVFQLFRNTKISPIGYSPFLKFWYEEVTPVVISKKMGARIEIKHAVKKQD